MSGTTSPKVVIFTLQRRDWPRVHNVLREQKVWCATQARPLELTAGLIDVYVPTEHAAILEKILSETGGSKNG